MACDAVLCNNRCHQGFRVFVEQTIVPYAETDYQVQICAFVIEELRLPQDDARKPITYAGMSVQDINWEMCREDMAEFLECGWLVIADEDEDFYE